MWQSVTHPAWSMAVLRHGIPRFRTIEQYLDGTSLTAVAGFVGASLGGSLSFDYVAEVRAQWTGNIVVKGILDPADARRSIDVGADAIWVSNHGGRQLEARRRRSAAYRRSPPRSAMRYRSCSTPVSARGPTSPGRSASGRFRLRRSTLLLRARCTRCRRRRARLRDPPRRPAERDAPDRLCPPGRAARTDR